MDGDGKEEILTALGAGYEPRVRIFDADGTQRGEFLAYASSYDRGVFVDGGDIDGDGKAEVVTGTDNGGGPHVRIFDEFGTVKGSFFAYDEAFRGGVRVAVGDLGEDGKAEIYTAAGPGGGPHVRIFDEHGKVTGSFFAFEEDLRNGVNVAVW